MEYLSLYSIFNETNKTNDSLLVQVLVDQPLHNDCSPPVENSLDGAWADNLPFSAGQQQTWLLVLGVMKVVKCNAISQFRFSPVR